MNHNECCRQVKTASCFHIISHGRVKVPVGADLHSISGSPANDSSLATWQKRTGIEFRLRQLGTFLARGRHGFTTYAIARLHAESHGRSHTMFFPADSLGAPWMIWSGGAKKTAQPKNRYMTGCRGSKWLNDQQCMSFLACNSRKVNHPSHPIFENGKA